VLAYLIILFFARRLNFALTRLLACQPLNCVLHQFDAFLANNQFTGALPTEVGLLTSLRDFDLG
jgi:hypothetical protein